MNQCLDKSEKVNKLKAARLVAPKIYIYQGQGGDSRVMTFGGLLRGMMAAWEGTDAWYQGFALAERLGVKPQPLYDFTGSLEP